MCGEVRRRGFLLRLKDRAGLLSYFVVNKSHVLSVSVDKCTFDLKLTTTQRVLKLKIMSQLMRIHRIAVLQVCLGSST